jgi:hypothetical protein
LNLYPKNRGDIGSSGVDMETAEEPDRDKDDQNDAESTAQSRAAVPAVPIISASAAEQQN